MNTVDATNPDAASMEPSKRKMKTKHTHPKEELSLLFALESLVLVMTSACRHRGSTGSIAGSTSARGGAVCDAHQASVVAPNQAIFTTLGTVNPNGMIYARKQGRRAIDH